MPNILFVSYHFPPTEAIGGRRAGRFARILPRKGFSVDVVCSAIPDIGTDPHDNPLGVGFMDPSQSVLLPEGVTVTRCRTPFLWNHYPEPPLARSIVDQIAWRVKAHAHWWLSSVDWAERWGRSVAESVDPSSYDLLLVDAPPNQAIGPIVQSARKAGVPIVTDLRDLWLPADPAVSRMHPGPRARRLRRSSEWCREVMAQSAKIVMTSPHAIQATKKALPEIPPSRFALVHNAYDSLDPISTRPVKNISDPILMVYTGSLSYGRDRLVLRLMDAMKMHRDRGGRPIELTIAGLGQDHLMHQVRTLGLESAVHLIPWVTRDEAVRLQREADVLLLLQPNNLQGTSVAIPGKLFEYMERRRPIFSLSTPAADEIIESYGLGTSADQDDPEAIAHGLDKVSANSLLYREILPPAAFEAESTTDALASILHSVLAQNV